MRRCVKRSKRKSILHTLRNKTNRTKNNLKSRKKYYAHKHQLFFVEKKIITRMLNAPFFAHINFVNLNLHLFQYLNVTSLDLICLYGRPLWIVFVSVIKERIPRE